MCLFAPIQLNLVLIRRDTPSLHGFAGFALSVGYFSASANVLKALMETYSIKIKFATKSFASSTFRFFTSYGKVSRNFLRIFLSFARNNDIVPEIEPFVPSAPKEGSA